MKSVKEIRTRIAGKYPYLGELEGRQVIVLFTGPKTGIVVFKGDGWDVGQHGTFWDEDQFIACTDEVILSND